MPSRHHAIMSHGIYSHRHTETQTQTNAIDWHHVIMSHIIYLLHFVWIVYSKDSKTCCIYSSTTTTTTTTTTRARLSAICYLLSAPLSAIVLAARCRSSHLSHYHTYHTITLITLSHLSHLSSTTTLASLTQSYRNTSM
jgi:hypothetical protein